MINVREFLNKQEWIFAKTYAKTAPHEYCLKENVVGTTEEFEEVCACILKYGFEAKWLGKYPNRYIYMDGHMYWIMCDDAVKSILINRSETRLYDYNIYPKKEKE